MVLIDITKREKDRFLKLQKDGMLPSQALKRLETERRLGIIPEEPKKFFDFFSSERLKENWWVYGSLGLIGAGIIYIYIKAKTPTVVSQRIRLSDLEYGADPEDLEDLIFSEEDLFL